MDLRIYKLNCIKFTLLQRDEDFGFDTFHGMSRGLNNNYLIQVLYSIDLPSIGNKNEVALDAYTKFLNYSNIL